MKKETSLKIIYDDLKDNISNDTDIKAISSILTKLLGINIKTSIDGFNYIITNYDIKALKHDIDFKPLLYDYLISLSNYIDYKELMHLIKDSNIKDIIDNYIFNIFKKDNLIYKYIIRFINNKDISGEEAFIEYFRKEYKIDPIIYDDVTMLKNIILIHIHYNYTPKDLLIKLAKSPIYKKDRAILASLIYDYI